MKLRELKAKLAAIPDDDIEVVIRCNWEDDEPAGTVFALRGVSENLEPDTAESFVALDCDQDFEQE